MTQSTAVPPGPRAPWGAKTMLAFRRDPLSYLTHLRERYGDTVSFRSLRRTFYMFYHPDQIRDVLVTQESCFIKGPALRQATDMLGRGLLTSEGDFHLRQRRLAQPAFHPQRVNTYATAMVNLAQRAADRWQDGHTVDAHEQMMQLTLEIVAKTLFDADVGSEVDALGRDMDVSVKIFTRAMLPFGWVLNKLPLPSTLRFRAARQRLWATVMRFVAERRASGVDRGDLLSMLLRATDEEGDHAGMTDEQLRDECITLFTAGHETTANALTFTWHLLAQNPEVEAKLHEELATVLNGRPPTNEDVPKLPYTRAVLAESMRLYPPAWAVGREVITECEIGGWRLPPKSVVLLSQWVTHRDGRFWPEPLKMDPTRWLGKTDRPRYAYYPFGGGVRSCVGEAFAWMEGILLIATLAQRWRFELTDTAPLDLQPTITLRPRHGIRMALRKR